jgi:hypothetical protein
MKTITIRFPQGKIGRELLYYMGIDWMEEKSELQRKVIEKCAKGGSVRLTIEEAESLYNDVVNAADIKLDHLDNPDWTMVQQAKLNRFGADLFNKYYKLTV